MNYKQKYEEALERAKKDLQACGSLECDAARQIFRVFPELGESEDEKIRKGLIKGLSAMKNIHNRQTFSDDAINIDDAIAWLEKQGEQKPTDKDEPKFKVGDWIVQENIGVPATKEQRDLLFQKMKEAGYEWDAEKKELKKIGQKLTWSKEDEKRFEYCKRLVYASDKYSVEDREETVDWLKSIKDRVQPQPKQEWSKEDKSMYIRTLGILGKCYMGELPTKVEEELNWFKSIEPKSHWKPSEEQIKSLRIALQTMPYSKDKENVLVILEELNKL